MATDALCWRRGTSSLSSLALLSCGFLGTEIAEGSKNENDRRREQELTAETEGAARTLRWFPRIQGSPHDPEIGPEYDLRTEKAVFELRRLGIRGAQIRVQIGPNQRATQEG
jgi:hypothetical protein